MNEEDLESRLRPELDEALLALDELTMDSPEEALSMFETLPEPVQALPAFQLSLARTHQAMGQLEAARDLAQGVAQHFSQDAELAADTHHFLGDVLEDLGNQEKADEHFQKTLELDRLAFEEEFSGDVEALKKRLLDLLSLTLDNLPGEVASSVRAASKKVELFPTSEEVQAGLDPRAFIQHRPSPGGQAPQFVLYAANLQTEYGDLEEFGEFLPHVKDCIHQQVIDVLCLSPPESKRLGLVREL